MYSIFYIINIWKCLICSFWDCSSSIETGLIVFYRYQYLHECLTCICLFLFGNKCNRVVDMERFAIKLFYKYMGKIYPATVIWLALKLFTITLEIFFRPMATARKETSDNFAGHQNCNSTFPLYILKHALHVSMSMNEWN